jgi:hypothetical protein
MSRLLEEEFADTKGVIRIGKSKDRQHNREPLNRNESGRFGALKSDSTHHFFINACTKSVSLRFLTVFRLLTDFVCLYNYEF